MFDGLEEEFDTSFSFEELDEVTEEQDEQDDFIQDTLDEEDLDEIEEINLENEDEDLEEYDDEEYDEEDEFDDEPSFSPFIQTLEESGLLFLDPDKEYDDSVEGFNEVIEDTIEAKFIERLEGLSPTARRLMEVEMNGGNIEEAFTVFNSFDYSEVDISDPDVQRELVREYYQTINPRWDDSKITKKLDGLDASDDLSDEAREAQEFFIEKKQQDEENYLEHTRAQREQAEQAYYQEMEEYENIIDSNDSLSGLPFTNRMEKEEFKRYCFEVGEDGLTQAQRDDEDKEVRITKEFYKFKKFQFSDVEKKAKTRAIVDMKKQLSHFGRKAPGTTRTQSKRKDDGSFSLGDVDYNIG
jgi:hypothetical protein